VAMRESGRGAEPPRERGQRFLDFAEHQEFRRGALLGRRVVLAVEAIDRAAGQYAAEMIVGAALAEADLEHGAGNGGDQARGLGEIGALGDEARGEALERASLRPAGLGRPRQALLAVSLRLVASSRRASSRMISTAICGNS